MLPENKVIAYWKKRVGDQGERATGHVDCTLKDQRKFSDVVRDFIRSHCPTDLITLDYGCGTGRYADLFDEYIGYDITQQLIDIAKKNHPAKKFFVGNTPYLCEFGHDYEMILTVTVLQHNSDDLVKKILQSIRQNAVGPLIFCLLENTTAEAEHCVGRSPDRYLKLLREICKIGEHSGYKFDNNHSLLVAKTKG